MTFLKKSSACRISKNRKFKKWLFRNYRFQKQCLLLKKILTQLTSGPHSHAVTTHHFWTLTSARIGQCPFPKFPEPVESHTNRGQWPFPVHTQKVTLSTMSGCTLARFQKQCLLLTQSQAVVFSHSQFPHCFLQKCTRLMVNKLMTHCIAICCATTFRCVSLLLAWMWQTTRRQSGSWLCCCFYYVS
jgi:hypothetical protein